MHHVSCITYRLYITVASRLVLLCISWYLHTTCNQKGTIVRTPLISRVTSQCKASHSYVCYLDIMVWLCSKLLLRSRFFVQVDCDCYCHHTCCLRSVRSPLARATCLEKESWRGAHPKEAAALKQKAIPFIHVGFVEPLWQYLQSLNMSRMTKSARIVPTPRK